MSFRGWNVKPPAIRILLKKKKKKSWIYCPKFLWKPKVTILFMKAKHWESQKINITYWDNNASTATRSVYNPRLRGNLMTQNAEETKATS